MPAYSKNRSSTKPVVEDREEITNSLTMGTPRAFITPVHLQSPSLRFSPRGTNHGPLWTPSSESSIQTDAPRTSLFQRQAPRKRVQTPKRLATRPPRRPKYPAIEPMKEPPRRNHASLSPLRTLHSRTHRSLDRRPQTHICTHHASPTAQLKGQRQCARRSVVMQERPVVAAVILMRYVQALWAVVGYGWL